MNAEILDKFSTHLKNALVRAYALAQELRQSSIEPSHLMYALAAQKGSIASEVLAKLGASSEDIKRFVGDVAGALPGKATKMDAAASESSPKLSGEAKRTIEKAVLTANLHEHKYVGTEHLLSAILQVAGDDVEPYFESRGIPLKMVKDQIASVLKSTSKFPDMTETFDSKAKGEGKKDGSKAKATAGSPTKNAAATAAAAAKTAKTPALDFFGVDMTSKKLVEKFETVIGREREVERMTQVLCRKTKNNPVLLGEPGVGKTAIVEGLAKKIAGSEVPPALEGKRIISIDLGLIIAGTIYRGEFESRLKQIIDEVKSHPEIILFIDELHMIMGAGAASGSIDAANILKPALARGEIRCIGATTLAEYKKHIEADGALERRFQAIQVAEPTPEQAADILRGLRESFENFHNVKISDAAIESAVQMSVRYIQDRFLPDKAIDLIDEAAAMLRVNEGQNPELREARDVESKLSEVRTKKQQAVVSDNFDEALTLKEHEKALQKKMESLEKGRADALATEVTAGDIAKVLARSTGIPVEEIVFEEKRNLAGLEDKLRERVIGQDEAVKAVAESIRRARLGLANPNRPLASFLFMGPSGVGKTELAKAIAETVFRDKEAFVRVDMSEFTESFNISKLIGSPAGYVGYRDSNKFADAVKRRPYSVVLFDELEKAHPDVLNIFLQIFEDGHLTDATGKKINFKNTIIIMTSNVGSQHLRTASVGFNSSANKSESVRDKFNEAKGSMLQDLERQFKPEFINRIDKVILFRPLDLESLQKIVTLHINDLNRRLEAEHHIKVALTSKGEKLIAEKSFIPLQGARGVRKTIQELVENLIAERLLSGDSDKGGTVRLTVKDDVLVVKP
ncbi:MAG: ATP-dependent Clp protease ATP-binding subunit [Patescibacteria group bacterium]|jgi:ATP-dependent Clp protease ATP-binding subunit ClpC